MDNTFNYINKNKLSENLLRTHCVSVRLNNEELHLLNTKRGDDLLPENSTSLN
ncbi:hypothetical protein CWZ05_004359 [Salmonella enterica]|nr:hypothetical protein [Salmonella enterica subsp. arizonae serovar 13,23:gz51:-]EDR4667815.1 hypothetical protein [Salmonella enterica]EDT8062064.1 hypothetical protein [Salmonella enterica]